MWDLATGVQVSVLEGPEAEEQLAATKQWRDAPRDNGVLVATTTEDSLVVSIASREAPRRALCTVLVPPPEALSEDTMVVSAALGVMAGFTKDSYRFLAFKLCLTP